MVEIHEVLNRKDLEEFIRFPYRLYKGDPNWVPPLIQDERNTLRKDKNPAYRFCEARFWLALKDGRTVGRIAGIRNDKFIEKWKQRKLRFGWVDFEDDPAIPAALFGAVEKWAAEQNLDAVHGPLGFTDLDKEGLLVEGFDEKGTLPMIYNHAYYPRYMESLGYKKDVDWLEFEIHVPSQIHEKFGRLKEIVFKKNDLQLVNFRKTKDVLPYAEGLFNVINKAYAPLYGVVELEDEQIECYTKQYLGFVHPDFTKIIVDKNKEVIAFAIAMPRLTGAMQKARGRLFPFGIIPVLKAVRKPEELVFYLIGVRPDFQNKGVTAILMTELYAECIRHGIRTVHTCGELEHNSNVISLMGNFEHRQHKRRRCYIKILDQGN